MKRINTAIIAAVAASLILAAGCYEGGISRPEPIGYDGFIEDGWDFFDVGDYEAAMNSFQQAIDMDATRPEGYLGVGWCSILLPDYWGTGGDYCYMATQQDGGTWPLSVFSMTMEQDLAWTEFECIYPQLNSNDSLVINSWGTTDSLWVDTTLVFPIDEDKTDFMDNYEIGIWLRDQYGVGTRFQYRFEIPDPNVVTIFTVFNGYSQTDAEVDSIVNMANHSEVYLSVPYVVVPVGNFSYRTWIMYENPMSFTYATYEPTQGSSLIADDAVAAYATLQHIRGDNGDPMNGCAALVGLAKQGDYSFEHWSNISSTKLIGMAASIAYNNTYFRYALSICQDAGYALEVTADDPGFLVELLLAIEMMLI